MSIKKIIYIDSDNVVQLDVRDVINGRPITNGNVLLRILNDDGTDINGSPFILTHLPSQPGTWRTVISYLFTGSLQKNKEYKSELIINSPAGRMKSEFLLKALVKPLE
ncbi:MAG: hypothetical protein QW303_00440 [Nitrososphaerota archaeon]